MKIDADVASVLERARFAGPVLVLPEGQLDRKLYERVNKALTLLGGRWDRRQGGHVFGEPAEDALDEALMTGEIADRRKELQAFYTPPAVAQRVIEAAGIQAGMRVLEPSAGRGALALPAQQAGAWVMCIEKDPDTFAALVAAGAEGACMDFLDHAPNPTFDKVIMNPPVSRQQDMKHVLHALQFLRPGGRLVAIMSPGFRHRQTAIADAFRDELQTRGGTVENLPFGSFKESGTMVDTVLVSIPEGREERS